MTRDWCCPDCHQPLGRTRSDRRHQRGFRSRSVLKLVILDRVDIVQPRLTCYVVHCPCGGYREWRGGKIEGPDKG
jgi:hypothetical protein